MSLVGGDDDAKPHLPLLGDHRGRQRGHHHGFSLREQTGEGSGENWSGRTRVSLNLIVLDKYSRQISGQCGGERVLHRRTVYDADPHHAGQPQHQVRQGLQKDEVNLTSKTRWILNSLRPIGKMELYKGEIFNKDISLFI